MSIRTFIPCLQLYLANKMGPIIQELLRDLHIVTSADYNHVLDFPTSFENPERAVREGGAGTGC